MSKRGPEPESEENHSAKKARALTGRRVRVSNLEWKVAKRYFNNQKNVKLNKKYNKVVKHSFIKIRGQLVALANKRIEGKRAVLGEGAFGRVKLAKNQAGKDFALKVEAGKKRAIDNEELKVLEKVPNFYHGETERRIPKKAYMGKETTSKLYTLMELLDGKELEKQLDTLNNTQKLIVALKSCLSIRELHQNNIIHADIKPANFMASIRGNNISVRAVDFGFSMLLKPRQQIIYKLGWKGTPDYMAPEVYSGQYSAQSDIYALGIMFKNDLGLAECLYGNMLHKDLLQRSSLKSTISALLTEIEIAAKNDAVVRQEVADIRAQLMRVQPKPTAGFLAHWQHFYQRASQIVQAPLAFICKEVPLVKR